ncbi:MAG: tripartite tricarboxylate transporter substrate binding protein [Betaproteobacteria bacterium]|nr:tripartite tricarboxylate transporter substrate binding protein [Betaproteobacteria bacterium]
MTLPCRLRVGPPALLALAVLCSMPAQAAERWPSRPIRIVVPYAAGGNSDDILRPVEPRLAAALGQPVIIDNRPGGGTQIGTAIVARSEPDGYTLLYVPVPFVVNPGIRSKLPYDSLKDFAPITQVMTSPLVLVVNREIEANSVSQLIALAKAKPGALSFGSGMAGAGHLAGELMKGMAGIDMVHIPYKGSAPAMTDLIGGRIQIIFATASAAIAQMQGGRLKALAVTTARRSSSLPDLPTLDEAGLKGFDVSVWGGLAGPARTPQARVAKLHAQLVRILALAEIKERFKAAGAEPVGSTPNEFGKFLRTEIEKWTKVVKRANIRVE